MEINSLSGFLNNITDNSAAQAKNDELKFQSLLEKATTAQEAGTEDEALLEACEEFESYYLNKVFSQMRKTIPESGLTEASAGRDYYEDMLYEAYSKEIAKGSASGIKEILYEQLKRS